MASKAVDFATDLKAGKTIEAKVYYPNLLITKANIDAPETKTYGLWGDAK